MCQLSHAGGGDKLVWGRLQSSRVHLSSFGSGHLPRPVRDIKGRGHLPRPGAKRHYCSDKTQFVRACFWHRTRYKLRLNLSNRIYRGKIPWSNTFLHKSHFYRISNRTCRKTHISMGFETAHVGNFTILWDLKNHYIENSPFLQDI